jgi:hydrogenase nickel incorporation protein HypA/HybF
VHELSICEAMLTQLRNLVTAHGALGVRTIRIQVGELAGVEPELLKRAFSVACAGGCAAEAALSIEVLPVVIRCLHCEVESTALPNRMCCPNCGANRVQVVSGEQLLLRQVELRMPEPVLSRIH